MLLGEMDALQGEVLDVGEVREGTEEVRQKSVRLAFAVGLQALLGLHAGIDDLADAHKRGDGRRDPEL
jgi:hypothetical protein